MPAIMICRYYQAALHEDAYRLLVKKLRVNLYRSKSRHKDWVQYTCTHTPRCLKPCRELMEKLDRRLREDLV